MTDFAEQCGPAADVERGSPSAPTAALRQPEGGPLQRQRAIVAMGRRAIAPPELRHLMQDAAELMAEVLGTEYSLAAGLSPDGQSLQLRLTPRESAGDGAKELARETGRAATDSLAGYALHTARPVVAADLSGDERFADKCLCRHGIRSAIAVPLGLPDQAFGALAACSTEPREFDDEDLLFVETVAHLASAAIGRIRAEQSLAEEQRLTTGVLQTVNALVLILNGQGQVVSINPACQRLTGFSIEEIRGRHVWDLFCVAEEVEVCRCLTARLRDEKVPVEYESRLLTKHSEQRHIAWSCSAIDNDDGALDSIIATGVDITEQYRAQEEAQRAVQAAEQARQVMARALLAAERGSPPSPPASSAAVLPTGDLAAETDSGPLPPHVPVERRRHPRRAFPYKQRIAPVLDGKLPDRKVFKDVRCRDVAASGFSFLHPTPPASDTLVVALGVPPNVTHLVAQVVHVTRFDDSGQRKFLVGCKYVGRAAY